MIRLLAACSPGEVRVAVLKSEILSEYALWRPGSPDGLGDVHAGRVATRVPAMAGAFVEIGGATGFLPDSAGAAGLTEGARLSVRITRTAQGGKGPRLAACEAPAEAGAPRLLQRGPGALLHLAGRYPEAPVQIDDAAKFASLRAALGDRLALVPQAFDDMLEEEIDRLATHRAALPGGMQAIVSPTPALTAIDIDGGAISAAKSAKAGSQMQANRAALPALVRQIVLRNLSGAIMIDFAGIAARRRQALAPELHAAFEEDPARGRLLGFTQLGLAEILRPRGAAPLHELLAGPHAAGLAALRLLVREAQRRTALSASPSVVAALQADGEALADLARRLTHPLILRSDPSLPVTGWRIEDAT